jgi:hypothetical protein
VDFYRLRMTAGESLTIRAVSSAFRARVYIGGAGFDAQCRFNDCSYNYGAATGDTVRVPFTAYTSGQYTVMVGPDASRAPFGTTGGYSIDIQR